MVVARPPGGQGSACTRTCWWSWRGAEHGLGQGLGHRVAQSMGWCGAEDGMQHERGMGHTCVETAVGQGAWHGLGHRVWCRGTLWGRGCGRAYSVTWRMAQGILWGRGWGMTWMQHRAWAENRAPVRLGMGQDTELAQSWHRALLWSRAWAALVGFTFWGPHGAWCLPQCHSGGGSKGQCPL